MIKSYPAPKPYRKSLQGDRARGAAMAAKRLFLFFAAMAFGGLSCLALNDGQLRFENYLYAQISEPIRQIEYEIPQKPLRPELDLDAKAALSLRIGASGRERVIYKDRENEILPIASITKLMTAAVVYDNPSIYNMDRPVVISRASAWQDDVPVYGNLKVGQIYTVRELLNLMLFYSSNDAAFALAEVAGSDKFIDAMNEKARILGLESTVFYNPSGLDGAGGNVNFSTAADLLKLSRYLLESHSEIFSLTIDPVTSLTENGLFAVNLWDGQALVGGKTGFTEKAGGCMIYIFENENHRRYINILLGSASSEARVAQMQKLVNYVNNTDRPTNQ